MCSRLSSATLRVSTRTRARPPKLPSTASSRCTTVRGDRCGSTTTDLLMLLVPLYPLLTASAACAPTSAADRRQAITVAAIRPRPQAARLGDCLVLAYTTWRFRTGVQSHATLRTRTYSMKARRSIRFTLRLQRARATRWLSGEQAERLVRARTRFTCAARASFLSLRRWSHWVRVWRACWVCAVGRSKLSPPFSRTRGGGHRAGARVLCAPVLRLACPLICPHPQLIRVHRSGTKKCRLG
jgi:hypothetical protein